MRRYFKLAYSDKGIWRNINITLGDKIIMYLPLFNTIAYIIFIILSKPLKLNKY